MADQTIAGALILGFVEGLTEFIPVSSTGHILLLGHFLGFKSTGKTFEVLIQLGAILAILSVYFGRLLNLAAGAAARRRRRAVSSPACSSPSCRPRSSARLLHDFIKTVLFETPMLICIMLILGGIVLLFIDRMPLKPRYTRRDGLSRCRCASRSACSSAWR